jgi:DTW domain-containing protein YfiP
VRSHCGPELKGRCKTCWVVQSHCLCAQVPKVPNRTRVMVLRHHHESTKTTNTARIAALALERMDIVEWWPRTPPDVNALLALREPAWVLYPGGSPEPAGERPQTLLVLDATWKQSRKMLHHHASLHRLPRFGLPGPAPAVLRLRGSKNPQARSTLEAIAAALTILDGPEVGEPLLQLHALMVERILRARGYFPKAPPPAGPSPR